MNEKHLDVICIGRSSVDLYGEQVGGPLEDMQSFAKYVGGCPTNIAVGTSRLGLKSGLITRVGDEQMGRFIRQTLIAEGVDVNHVATDQERLTALVILGIRDRGNSPHIFYRENCADMAIKAEHIDRNFIASAKAIVVTGTHFSTPGVEGASRAAMRYARDAGSKVALDIDYRPVAWGLTDHGDGENRFVENAEVTAHILSIVPDCDLIVGTEEEFHIAGGSTDTLEALNIVRGKTDAALVLKRGPLGCAVFAADIPNRIEDGISIEGREVEVFNTLGAGDGFMSGFLRGWIRGEDWQTCCRYANASGALVVSRHGCAPAIPSWEELQTFLKEGSDTIRLREDKKLAHLHRVTTGRQSYPEVCAIAFDHRTQFEDMAHRNNREISVIEVFKKLIADGARNAADNAQGLGAIVDDIFGFDILAEMGGGQWWLARPVEEPGSRPLNFIAGHDITSTLREWPVNHVAKCLISYHPSDDGELKQQQLQQAMRLYKACITTGHELLLEIIPPALNGDNDEAIVQAVAEFYDAGIQPDWWKLAPPEKASTWDKLAEVIEHRDPHCRGILMLGLNAPIDDLLINLETAAGKDICKGFAVGRSVFQQAAEQWFAKEIGDGEAIAQVSRNYRRLLSHWESCRQNVQPI